MFSCVLAEWSHSAKYLIKPVVFDGFRVRATAHHGPYSDSSTSRRPSHAPQHATKVENTRDARSTAVVASV